MNDDFRHNLGLLCSYFRSVSEVCRRIGINRAQFNKYLRHGVRPSRNNLRRICDFFGVEEHEILLPGESFAELIRTRPARLPGSGGDGDEVLKAMEQIQAQSRQNELEAYAGYYFEYYFSMSFPGKVLKTLVHVQAYEKVTLYERFERLEPVGTLRRGARCHYRGQALFLKDRLFLTDYEALTGNEVSQTILFPSYKSVIDRLDGLKIGVAATGKRTPAACRVMWDYLGQTIDLRQAYRHIGVLDPESSALEADIGARIDNGLTDVSLFLARAGDA